MWLFKEEGKYSVCMRWLLDFGVFFSWGRKKTGGIGNFPFLFFPFFGGGGEREGFVDIGERDVDLFFALLVEDGRGD